MAFRPHPEFSLSTSENVTSIPKEKLPGRSGTAGYSSMVPVTNSGNVEVKCVINRTCPFVKSSRMHDTLVFNSQSIRNYPADVMANFDSVPGSEGMYIKPTYTYRHTFIAAPKKPVSTDIGTQNNGQGTNGRRELKKVNAPKGTFASGSPVYERHQRFIVTPNVFETEILVPGEYASDARENPTSCKELARWDYELISRGGPAENLPDGSNNLQVLMPKQIAGTTCSGAGVHWRVEKQTPLFKGQDFFFEFHRRANSIDIPQSIYDPDNSFLNDPFKIEKYRPLDVKYMDVEAVPNGCDSTNSLHKNRGIVRYSNNNQVPNDNKTYDFRDQAYYVLEIGASPSGNDEDDWDQQYFIIITQRGNPICVRIDTNGITSNGSTGSSVLISEFADGTNVEENSKTQGAKISGKQIIESEWCRMSVRNHLGDLHVWFEGPSFRSSTWIINRVDSVSNNSSIQGDTRRFVKNQPKQMYVPKGTVALWGGNLNAGFLFGTLQYLHGDTRDSVTPISFICPPASQEQSSQSVCNTTANSAVTLTSTSGNLNNLTEDTIQSSLSLPSDTLHKYLLTATDEPVPGNTNRYFFTQDAQKFIWVERQGVNGTGGGGSRTAPGTFFNKRLSYKEISPGLESVIEIKGLPITVDSSTRAALFKIEIKLTAGGHKFENDANGYIDGDGNSEWTLNACKTPVLTSVRLAADPTNVSRWQTREVDVSEHVLDYSECWSAQDFFKIEHTGNIRFLVNYGARYDNNQTEYLLSLLNKAFYIEVWVRYHPSTGDNGSNYSKLSGFYKLFTGICYGGTLNIEMGERIMECQIQDYSKILQDMLFFNSPFYDGVRDVNAVREIMQMAGFKETSNTDPGVLLQRFSRFTDQTMHFGVGPDGRLVPVAAYALPSAYAKLNQPFFKFNDGSKLYDGIMQIGQRGGKCFFFDAHGVAHFESYFDFAVVGVMSGIDNQVLGGSPPRCVPGPNGTGSVPSNSQTIDAESLSLWWYTTNPNAFQGQLVHDSVKIQRVVGDVYNHVKIMTNTPDFEVIFADDVDWGSIDKPDKEGFIGYMKTVYQQDGIFGSLEAARNIINFYKAMRIPPLVVNFSSFGLPVRALDLIAFDGQMARIMKVDATISVKENKWWNNIEAEWLFAGQLGEESAACTPPDENPPAAP
jgi:hypothetical protein